VRVDWPAERGGREGALRRSLLCHGGAESEQQGRNETQATSHIGLLLGWVIQRDSTTE
jgi:hypothetical protein